MNKHNELQKKFEEIAERAKKHRKDPRFVRTMGFLTAKGFLFANTRFPYNPNDRIDIDDAVWAGKTLEPRILEVLPAAVLRLPKHFDFDPIRHHELARTLEDLRARKKDGHRFAGVPYKKLKVWVDFILKDGRVKTLSERKILKTFRLRPGTIERLEKLAARDQKNVTTVIEELIQKA